MFDTTFSRNFSLLESCREFVQRYKESETNKTALPMLASACPGKMTTVGQEDIENFSVEIYW